MHWRSCCSDRMLRLNCLYVVQDSAASSFYTVPHPLFPMSALSRLLLNVFFIPMLATPASAQSFSDVNTNDAYATAVENLKAQNVI